MSFFSEFRRGFREQLGREEQVRETQQIVVDQQKQHFAKVYLQNLKKRDAELQAPAIAARAAALKMVEELQSGKDVPESEIKATTQALLIATTNTYAARMDLYSEAILEGGAGDNQYIIDAAKQAAINLTNQKDQSEEKLYDFAEKWQSLEDAGEAHDVRMSGMRQIQARRQFEMDKDREFYEGTRPAREAVWAQGNFRERANLIHQLANVAIGDPQQFDIIAKDAQIFQNEEGAYDGEAARSSIISISMTLDDRVREKVRQINVALANTKKRLEDPKLSPQHRQELQEQIKLLENEREILEAEESEAMARDAERRRWERDTTVPERWGIEFREAVENAGRIPGAAGRSIGAFLDAFLWGNREAPNQQRSRSLTGRIGETAEEETVRKEREPERKSTLEQFKEHVLGEAGVNY